MKLARFACLLMLTTGSLFAQTNPVPFVYQPLVPSAVAPGSPGFTLTVNGTAFVSGSVVNWNGSPRPTSFVNASTLTASISATDVAVANTATITVTSSAPGGGTSGSIYFPVRQPSATVSFSESYTAPGASPSFAITGDFNGDGKLDLATGIADTTVGLTILLGNGNGTFTSLETGPISVGATGLATADFNGDGKADIAVSAGNGGLDVLIGNGDGTFQAPVNYEISSTDYSIATGDFNGDGKVDLAVGVFGEATVMLGNGNGTFQPAVNYSAGCSSAPIIAVADTNSDGHLDLIEINTTCGTVSVFLGHGDGTFASPITSPVVTSYSGTFAIADFNGDGKLDLAVASADQNAVVILLGNGDGTFRPGVSYETAQSPDSVATLDYNGDGKLDLVVSSGYTPYGVNLTSSISILLGNGDGTFQPFTAHGQGAYGMGAAGDFNNDGMMDVAAGDNTSRSTAILLQDNGTLVSVSPSSLVFATQLISTVSTAQTVTLTNSGTSALAITNVSLGTVNFGLVNNCPRSLPAARSCKVLVYFTPTTRGNLKDSLSIFDNGGGSPQFVAVSGTGTVVTLNPTSLNFGDVNLHKMSPPQRVILTNHGSVQLQITKISVTGIDGQDFEEVNACGTSLSSGAGCTIDVWFTPKAIGSRQATLSISDSGGASPQTVSLAGTGQ